MNPIGGVNLDALTMLAEMGRHVGIDLRHFTAPNRGSIRKALLFAAPYADSTVKFPKADIAESGPREFMAPFESCGAAWRFGVRGCR